MLCWRGRATILALALVGVVACAPPTRPNVLLILIDTLRKDALRVYGNPQPTSPSIDALATSGWVFEHHVAHASQTVPSTLSLHLSRLPADHGFVHREIGQFSEHRPQYPGEFVFLAEVLREAGYATGAWVANPFLTRENAFDQGFETFEHVPWPSSQQLTRPALDWLESWSKDRARPFFAYLHLMDPHQPYRPPKRIAQRFASGLGGKALIGDRLLSEAEFADLPYTHGLYLAAVARADERVGAVLRKLDELGVGENTIVVVTSDHGEEFGDHGGIGHGTTVYGELVRVPLVMSYPVRLEPGRRVRELTQHLDLAPTILRLAGIAQPAEFRGTSVLERAERAFTEDGPWRAVYAGAWKLVLNLDTAERTLFRTADELDREPVDAPETSELLRRDLDAYSTSERARPPDPNSPAWSPEELERLRALGYAR